MKRKITAGFAWAALALASASIELAQGQTYLDTHGALIPGVVLMAGCPSGGGTCTAPVSGSNPLPVSGSFSASLSGFAPTPAYASLAVGAASARVALPTGTVVVVENMGANAACVLLGSVSAVATSSGANCTNDDFVPGNSALALTVGANTYLAAIDTSAGTSALMISGGAGLPTGWGGGGGAGGGSVPTGSAGSPNASVVTVQGIGGGAGIPVTGTFWQSTQPVSGTFWQSTQPVSIATLPSLAAGAANIGLIDILGHAGAAIDAAQNAAAPANVAVSGYRYDSALPTITSGNVAAPEIDASGRTIVVGAGTAGAAAGGVMSVQGIGGGAGVPVTGTFWQSTQPVSGTFWQSTQPVSIATLPSLAAGAANIGLIDILGHAGAAIDAAQNAAAPANVAVSGYRYDSALPTITSGNVAAPEIDASARAIVVGAGTAGAAAGGVMSVQGAASMTPLAGNIAQIAGATSGITTWGTAPTGNSVLNANVNCLSGCGGSGGTSASDNATFTSGTSNFTPMGGEVGGSALTSGHMGVVAMDTGRNLFANVNEWAGSALGAPSNYGTSPGAVAVPGVNAFITNTPAVSQSGTWNITNVSGTVSLPTGAATSANQPTNAAQASTTSGQTGQLVQGAVTTSAPTYTTAQTDPLSLTTAGALRVDGSASTQPVSGTVTANAGTNLNTSLLALEGGGNLASIKADADSLNLAQGSTTSGQHGNMVMGAVTTSAPAYTTAQTSPLSIDTSGNLRINCTTGCSSSGGSSLADEGSFTQGTTSFTVAGGFFNSAIANLTSGQAGAVQLTNTRHMKTDLEDWAGSALGAPSNYGTSPGAVAVPGVNAFITNTPAVSQSGTWNVGLSAGANTVGKVDVLGNAGAAMDVAIGGATAAPNALQAGGVYNSSAPTLTTGQGGALQLTSGGSLHATIDNSNANGQATMANSSPVVIASDQSAITVKGSAASGAALSGNPVLMAGGNGTNAYTLDTDTSGNLLVNPATIASWGLMSGTAAGTAPTNTMVVGQKYNSSPPSPTNGQALPLQSDANGRTIVTTLDLSPATITITAADAVSTSASWANSQSAVSGTPTANSAASFALAPGVESLSVQASGTFSETLVTEISKDGGTNWVAVPVFQDGIVGGHSSFTGAGVTANFAGAVNVAGATNFRVRATAFTSGTATIKVIESRNLAMVAALPPLSTGTATIGALSANQSTNLAQVGGTSSTSLMVAASTAPATATNPALTVDLRPDSPGIVTLGQTTKSASVPMTIASDQVGTAGTANATVFSVQGVASMTPVQMSGVPATPATSAPVALSSQYPVNSSTTSPIPETISATGTTASYTATLAAASGKTTFICGFEVDAVATAGTSAAMTLTGTVTGTLNFVMTVGTLAGVGAPQNVHAFSPCIPASAANTTIVVNTAAAGSGGISATSAWGYQL